MEPEETSPTKKQTKKKISLGGVASHFRSFVEMCGRHPFATGLFALLGIAGLLISITGFQLDRTENLQTTKDINSVTKEIGTVSDSVSKLNKHLMESDPKVKDKSIQVPLKLQMPKMYLDNVVFNQNNTTFQKQMNYQQADSLMQSVIASNKYSGHIPFYGFSINSLANHNFVQVAPYLIIEVLQVQKIDEKLAGIYLGERGGSGVLREFHTVILPKEGVHIAPIINTKDKIDYISLEPGEVEEMMLYFDFLPGYYYDFRIGVQVKFDAVNSVVWSNTKFHAGVPAYEIPLWDTSTNHFTLKQHPDVDIAVYGSTFEALKDLAKKNISMYKNSRVFTLNMVNLEVANPDEIID